MSIVLILMYYLHEVNGKTRKEFICSLHRNSWRITRIGATNVVTASSHTVFPFSFDRNSIHHKYYIFPLYVLNYDQKMILFFLWISKLC